MGLLPNVAALTILSLALYHLYRLYTRISVAKVPGPPSSSFIYGNLPELMQSQAGEADFKWQSTYGHVIKLKAPLGEDVLLISDPKALQYIYQTAGYRFPKHPEKSTLGRILTGPEVIWVEGDDHRRQRKVMHPGFGVPESKSFLPIFSTYAAKLSFLWKDVISTTLEQSAVVDIPSWTSRATLDAIGEAAFDYQFGALDNAENELTKVYGNVFLDAFGAPSNNSILFMSVVKYIPTSILQYFLQKATSPQLSQIRRMVAVASDVARRLVSEKSIALLKGHGNRDVMSLIVKANASENPNTRLSEEEMLAQMRTILLAGHETTSNTLGWILLELSRNPDVQSKLRHEIRCMERTFVDRGDLAFTPRDFESMPYLTAVLKESLRLHPVVYCMQRQAAADDILPLSTPITLTSGEVIGELPIPKGMKIITSVAGYNRIPEIFGSDTHSFNPDRWFGKIGPGTGKAVSVGVYGNLMTFAAGLKSCVGWRFAIVELQAFLVELVNNFEFSCTPEAGKIRREACTVMAPTIEGQVEKGTQMPLRIKVAERSFRDELSVE